MPTITKSKPKTKPAVVLQDYSAIEGLLRAIKPDPVLTVSEWSDTYRILPPTSAEPGLWRTSRTPYLKEILDKLSISDSAQKIIWKKPSQVGATEGGNCWLGYVMDIAPAPFMYVMPTDGMMKDTSKNRIQKMIDAAPRLRAKIKPANVKGSNNTIMGKEFEGGFSKHIGANSPVGLSSTAVRDLYMDEVDRYPLDVGGEGDAMALAETRTSTFGARKKIFITSTPTLEGSSIIDNNYKKTGQRQFNVPCPHCSAFQVLKFDQLRWEAGKPETAQYECEHCGELIAERHKTRMLAAGFWKPQFPEMEDGITFGYHLNALYSPYGWYSWQQMARDYEDSEGDAPKRIVFVNTKLGEVYATEGESPDWQSVYNRRETFAVGVPPEPVVFITAGVDIQKDRIEVGVIGWAKGKQSYFVEYRVLLGSTETIDGEAWKALRLMVDESFIRVDGAVMKIQSMAVDSGYNTSTVYEFCRAFPGWKVFPVKGQETQSLMVSQPKAVDTSRSGKKIEGVKVWNVGTSMIKTELYGYLKLQQYEDGDYPPGYCHYPEYDHHFFKSLTAEKLAKKLNKKGYTEYAWEKKYNRNEVLDISVYARAAAYVIGIDRLSPEQWDKLWADTKDLVPLVAEGEAPAKVVKKAKRKSIWDGR